MAFSGIRSDVSVLASKDFEGGGGAVGGAEEGGGQGEGGQAAGRPRQGPGAPHPRHVIAGREPRGHCSAHCCLTERSKTNPTIGPPWFSMKHCSTVCEVFSRKLQITVFLDFRVWSLSRGWLASYVVAATLSPHRAPPDSSALKPQSCHSATAESGL